MTDTYKEQKKTRALEAIDKGGNIVLQKNGDDALLFMPGAVAKFCIAHGYDEQTCSWSHGSYFSNLSAASMEFSPVETHPDERTEAIEHIDNLMEKINGLESVGVTDADTVLADMVERADFEQTGVAAEIFNLYTEADGAGREVIGSMFESLIGESFDTFLSEATKACEKTLEQSEVEAKPSPALRAKNNLRDALMGDQKSFIALLKEYGKDCALDNFDLFESIEQVAVEEDWSYERQQIQTEGLDRNAELYRFDSMGCLEATDGKEVIDEALEEFDDFCDWASGTELEYIGAYGTVSNDIKQAIAKYQDAVGKSGGEHDAGSDVPERSEAIQSLDEIIEQASEAAVDNELGDEMSVSNGER